MTKQITSSFARSDDEVLETTNPNYSQGRIVTGASAENVILADTSPSTTVLVDQQQVSVELDHDANTLGNPTFQLGTTATKNMVRDANFPLQSGDTGGIGYTLNLKYSLALDKWVILNPVKPADRGLSYVNGLTISNNSIDSANDIDISVGKIMDSTESFTMELFAVITKQIDNPFVVGNNAGGFSNATAALANSTWYRIFLIGKADGTTDVIFADTEANALADTVAAAAGFIYARRIGWFFSDSGSNVRQWEDGTLREYVWSAMIDALITTSTSAALSTVTVPPLLKGNFTYSLQATAAAASSTGFGVITSVGQSDIAPSNTHKDIHSFSSGNDASAGTGQSINKSVKVDGTSQIRHRENTSTFDAELLTISWTDDLQVA